MLGLAMLAACGLTPERAEPQNAELAYISAPSRPEDIATLPGTGVVAVSAIATSPQDTEAGVYLLDAGSGETVGRYVSWDPGRASGAFGADTCALEGAQTIAPHGIFADREARLFVVVHGPLEAILVYDVDTAPSGETRLAENTCIALPAGVFANAVTTFRGTGLAVTKMFDPTLGEPFERFVAQVPTGTILTWSREVGWVQHDEIALSGANGLLWDEERETLIIAEWAKKRIVALPDPGEGRPFNTPEVLANFGFMPDNLRWDADGSILVTGQASSIEEGHACIVGYAPCPSGFRIERLDPATGRAETVGVFPDSPLGMASVAARVGDVIWVGSVSGNEIAVLRAGEAP